MERHTSIQYGRKELGSYKVAASILTPSRNVSEHCKRIVISLSSRMKIKMKTISGVEMDEMGIDRQPLRVDFPWRLLERLTAVGQAKGAPMRVQTTAYPQRLLRLIGVCNYPTGPVVVFVQGLADKEVSCGPGHVGSSSSSVEK